MKNLRSFDLNKIYAKLEAGEYQLTNFMAFITCDNPTKYSSEQLARKFLSYDEKYYDSCIACILQRELNIKKSVKDAIATTKRLLERTQPDIERINNSKTLLLSVDFLRIFNDLWNHDCDYMTERTKNLFKNVANPSKYSGKQLAKKFLKLDKNEIKPAIAGLMQIELNKCKSHNIEPLVAVYETEVMLKRAQKWIDENIKQ